MDLQVKCLIQYSSVTTFYSIICGVRRAASPRSSSVRVGVRLAAPAVSRATGWVLRLTHSYAAVLARPSRSRASPTSLRHRVLYAFSQRLCWSAHTQHTVLQTWSLYRYIFSLHTLDNYLNHDSLVQLDKINRLNGLCKLYSTLPYYSNDV